MSGVLQACRGPRTQSRGMEGTEEGLGGPVWNQLQEAWGEEGNRDFVEGKQGRVVKFAK